MFSKYIVFDFNLRKLVYLTSIVLSERVRPSTFVHINSLGALPANTATFGAGSGQIWLDDISCIGNETGLISCETNSPGDNDCTHAEDAGVFCRDSE